MHLIMDGKGFCYSIGWRRLKNDEVVKINSQITNLLDGSLTI